MVGVPDQKYGEEVCAWVCQHRGKGLSGKELRDWCRCRLTAYKVPRYWRFVESYPMTTSGKVQKYVMRQQTTNWLHLGDASSVLVDVQ